MKIEKNALQHYILQKCIAAPPLLPTQHDVKNQVMLQVLVFSIVWGWGVGVRLARLSYICICVQKCQKCKFVPRLLSTIV